MAGASNVAAVTRAGVVDIADLAALAAATTWDTPAARWLVPDPQQRPGVLHAWYAIQVEHALRYGRVDLLADRSAAAVWLDRSRPTPAPNHYRRRLTSTCGRHTIAVLRYEQLLEKHRPRTAHLQLAVLAAPGPEQAAALLAHRHQHLDRIGIAAHATVSSVDERLAMATAGYQSGEPFQLPGGGPAMWALTRPPQPVRGSATSVRLAL
jgi:hypothetical protein